MAKGFLTSYTDSLRSLKGTDILFAVAVGFVAAVLYLFLFPGKAISTLMHEVMRLPGPGTGIGFIVGPYIILWAMIVWIFKRKAGLAFYVCAVFGLVQAYAGEIAGTSSVLGPQVAPATVTAAFILGVVVDMSAFATRGLADRKATIMVAIPSNMIFLMTYWVAVFPSVKGWVQPVPAVIMTIISLIGAILFGSVIPIIYGMVTGRVTKDPPRRKEFDDFGEEE